MNDQTAKSDAGKLDPTLVPRQIIWDIAEVRRYGNQKYHDPNNWKQVEIERYRAAAFRHFLAYLDEPHGKDPESGIEHYKHLACNLAFICEMEGKNGSEVYTWLPGESGTGNSEQRDEQIRNSQTGRR